MPLPCVHVGVDVGGTNTDAVVLKGDLVVGWSKNVTTADVTTGVCGAIGSALDHARKQIDAAEGLNVLRVHIGTTHFVNAVVQRRHLVRVSVIRLCGPTTVDLPPFTDFPEDLKQVIIGSIYTVDGGYEFDGLTEIRKVKRPQIVDVLYKLKDAQCQNIVVAGIFSPVNSTQEEQVKQIFSEIYPEASVTLSHEVGQIGLLERENAAVLNECLKPLSVQTVTALRTALDKLGLTCPFYLTQNDGTLISAEQALAQPVLTFASGPTNSMRGAAFLSGLKDAVVVDIGGTSTDAGVLVRGFPKEASSKVKVGRVRTNFRMPAVLSIGLGGGSEVNTSHIDGTLQVKVGPLSVGYKLLRESLVFGGNTMTASDLVVAAGLAQMGDAKYLAKHGLTPQSDVVKHGVQKIHEMIEFIIDQVKTSAEEVPVILVGGGSVLISETTPLKGTSRVYKPPNFQVANAVGAALSQVSGSVDYTVDLSKTSREEAIAQAKSRASLATLRAGADKSTIQITDVLEVPLAYVPGNVTRVKVKAVGDLIIDSGTIDGATWSGFPENGTDEGSLSSGEEGVQQVSTTTGKRLVEDLEIDISAQEKDPTIDPTTGEWILSDWDVECIAVGAGILGCGGGGSPHIGKLMALKRLKEGRKIRVISPEMLTKRMSNADCVSQVIMMGAPTIWNERLMGAGYENVHCHKALCEVLSALETKKCDTLTMKDNLNIKQQQGIKFIDDYQLKESPDVIARSKIVALFGNEVGGCNSMAALFTAPLLDLPVVDCDTMGRAFPEMQHNTAMIYGHPPYPGCISDHNGRTAVVIEVQEPKQLEDHFRAICVEMGCGAACAISPLHKKDIWSPENEGKVILHSLSRAWRLGKAVWNARKSKTNPIQAILEHQSGRLLFMGKIYDVQRKTVGGFVRGEMEIEGFEKYSGQTMFIYFQNENLVAKLRAVDGSLEVVACVPDLISLVEQEQGESVPTEENRYGLRVAVIAMPAPPLLRTPAALKVLGPQAFGYPKSEVEFVPMGDFTHYDPIPPV